jgi:hypothetical protein
MADQLFALLTQVFESIMVKVELSLYNVADDLKLISAWKRHLP